MVEPSSQTIWRELSESGGMSFNLTIIHEIDSLTVQATKPLLAEATEIVH